MKIDSFKRCLNNLEKDYKGILKKYEIPDLMLSLDKKTIDKIHPYKLDLLDLKYKEILSKYDQKMFENIRKIVILKCAVENWSNIFSEKFPQSIQEQYERNFKRFLDFCSQDQGWGEHIDDVYWKDLAIARQQIFPAGAQIVEAYSGFAWEQGFGGSRLLQSIRFLWFIITSGGKDGYYQIHTHTPELGEFNEQGWNNCYVRIAEMLRKNKHMKGMFGGSWFYDPQVSKISPKLGYLRKIPLENGARFFYIGEDKTQNAIAKSKTRRDLFRKGKYVPRAYLLIWPRKELINWAERFLKEQKDN